MTTASGRARSRRSHLWRLLAIWAVVFVAYSNSFKGALVFDSAPVIGQDPRIRQATLENIESILTGGYWYISATAGLYRPITTLSYLMNYAVFGDGSNPAGYHWVNLALHELNVALVYALGVLIFGEAAPAFALAAIWGVHPLLTESVTNIVGRADLLAAFGVLAGLLCYAKSVTVARRRMAWLAGLAVAATVGVFSKESGVVLPGLMLLYDLTLSDRANWRRRVPAYAAIALPFLAFFVVRGGAGTHMVIDPVENPLVSAGFWTARLTPIEVVGKYLWLFVWPARLSADYSYNAVPLGWHDPAASFAVMFAVVGVLLALRWRAKERPPLFFLVFFFVALAPVANIIVLIGSIMAERFLYLPSVGLAGCVVAAVYMAGRRRVATPHAWAALALVCVAFTARTHTRNVDWQDGLSLWTSAVQVCPQSARPHYNLAKELEHIPGRMPDAVAEYREAVRIQPDSADAHDNLGNALSGMPGRLPEAIAEYRVALRIQPALAVVHNDLANALARVPGGLAEAIAEYQTALRQNPGNAEVHYNLANALSGIPGRVAEAIAEYRAAVRIQPDHADAHNNLGNALAGIPGELPQAIAEYQAALRIQPAMAAAHVNLGNALFGMPGRLPDAIGEYQEALRLRPDNAEAHNNLGIALAGMPGRMADAVVEFQAAVRSAPDWVEAHTSLAKALSLTPGRRAEAVAEYEAALRLRPDPEISEALKRLLEARRE